jgi:hypothetical protein
MNKDYHKWRVSAVKFYQFIAEQTNVLHLPHYSDKEFISEKFDQTTNQAIDRCTYACSEVVQLHDNDEVLAREYTRTTLYNRMPRSGENRCKKWLKGYYKWLREREEPLKLDIPEIPIPKISIPDLSGDIKKSALVTGLVVMGFIALLVYLMFRGGAGRDLTVVT